MVQLERNLPNLQRAYVLTLYTGYFIHIGSPDIDLPALS
jgi:hypothetical protein